MKIHMFRALSVVLLGAAAGLAPVSAQAQNSKGSFELPYDVTWSGYNFVAGQYQIWTETELSGAPFIHLRGPNGSAILQYRGHDTAEPTRNGNLRLKDVDGVWVVEEFRAGPSGKVFEFGLPKARHAEIASTRGAETIITINGGE